MNTKTILVIIAGIILFWALWHYYTHPRIRCKIIHKQKEGQPEKYYYHDVRWNRTRRKGFIFDEVKGRWKFMSLRQRAEMNMCLKDHISPPEIHLH